MYKKEEEEANCKLIPAAVACWKFSLPVTVTTLGSSQS